MMHNSNGILSGKEGQKYFFSSALNNDKFLNENEYKAFDIYRECSHEVFSF